MPQYRDPHEQAQVALVLFHVGPYRAALEAHYVLAMTDRPTTLRTANAHSLLYVGGDHDALPSRWLTLRDPQTASDNNSTWQLGVSGDITLQQLPANTLYPLPKLLLSRRFSTALCGVTLDQQQLVLLLDARKLSP
ncbi:hypothetical protein J7J47_13720 [Halomonas sp. ISL-60]|uniref:hypothetical protein n=1 Tax=unclassified Halomonas TaxID=2609666 RepID=UPI0007D938F9|nr:hypothetical protein [Halomonas sp. ALS9]MBT2773281.1 hypothetical protein [Halomonas sp. ISL-60]MBT2786134.1 hypothetical protein [Halomonas sp. ISL-106]MBT2797156.1 hypothetical protein [Halomonas sp. ISL-104]MBT2801851.1 hypothetical protein [Halomonas sp. ISL-56]OAL58537.1 hypothetical protein A6R74_06495 [Halomonas sp. ALS9]